MKFRLQSPSFPWFSVSQLHDTIQIHGIMVKKKAVVSSAKVTIYYDTFVTFVTLNHDTFVTFVTLNHDTTRFHGIMNPIP